VTQPGSLQPPDSERKVRRHKGRRGEERKERSVEWREGDERRGAEIKDGGVKREKIEKLTFKIIQLTIISTAISRHDAS
jgi:hypothetical protein